MRSPFPIVKRTGTISNYRVARTEASFVFAESDKTKLGVVAVAAGIAGLSGQAIATASHAASTEEPADYVEFDFDGLSVKGWVWRSPFKEGDQVEVVGEINGSHLEMVAIARPEDRTIALYPHCSRGRARHVKNAAKWWFVGCSLFNLFVAGLILFIVPVDRFWNDMGEQLLIMFGAVYVFFGLMTISLIRKLTPFARVAERVFRALDWPNPSNVDLVKSSKVQRRPEEPGEFGTFFFRYY
jgi:hypothetical protein